MTADEPEVFKVSDKSADVEPGKDGGQVQYEFRFNKVVLAHSR